MSHIQRRGLKALNLEQYNFYNNIEEVATVKMYPTKDRQYILRMCIKLPFREYEIPTELFWCNKLITLAHMHQKKMGIVQPYCYVTVRRGIVESTTDDVWHVDGFSTSITHLPEQNYIWSDCHPTEWTCQAIKFPEDFDPQKHNIHSYIQKRVEGRPFQTLATDTLYCLDPYIIHRRPFIPCGTFRTFVRVSFTPIPIMDDNNTPNPIMPIAAWGRDGIKDFRDKLIDY